MAHDRILPIKSAYNFRDLGGYKSADGRHVRWNKLIRTSDFPNLSEDDKQLLVKYGVKHIIDLRSKPEVEQAPDDVIDGAEQHFLYIDAGNLVPRFKKVMTDRTLTEDKAYDEGLKLMKEMYVRLVTEYTETFSDFFRIIMADDSAKLFHCTAGKDRTGVATALLLSGLGIDRETIYDDYLLTNQALKGKYDDLLKYGKVASFFGNVHKELLQESFKIIDSEYGSVENFLKNSLSVDLDKLKSLYLE